MSNGLIDRAFLSGSHDPSLYYRKYPRINWKEKGGYEIQATPQEVAAIITGSRAWVKGSRMLAVGTGTLGAERFLAENLGMLDVEYIGDALPDNRDSIKAKKVNSPTGKYDLITVFGTAKVSALLPFSKIGTLVVFIGIGPLAKNSELRTAWLGLRKKHMTMLQTGGESWQTGVGVVKILFIDGQDKATPVNMEPNDDGKTGGLEETVLPPGDEVDYSSQVSVGHKENDGDLQITPKRRGRQPGSKNKAKSK